MPHSIYSQSSIVIVVSASMYSILLVTKAKSSVIVVFYTLAAVVMLSVSNCSPRDWQHRPLTTEGAIGIHALTQSIFVFVQSLLWAKLRDVVGVLLPRTHSPRYRLLAAKLVDYSVNWIRKVFLHIWLILSISEQRLQLINCSSIFGLVWLMESCVFKASLILVFI